MSLQPLKRPRAFRINEWVRPQDFSAALAVAGLKNQVPHETLSVAAGVANGLVHGLLVDLCSPTIPNFVALHDALRGTERAASQLLAHVATFIPTERRNGEDAAGLAAHLAAMRNPAVNALLGAAMETNRENPAHELAVALRALTRLRDWADRADRAIHDSSPGRVSSQQIGLMLIKLYEVISGRKAAFSRPSSPLKSKRKASGPLIRFLDHLFGCIRTVVEADGDLGDLTTDRSINPTAETLASWIRSYRQARESDLSSN